MDGLDGGYEGPSFEATCEAFSKCRVEIIKRSDAPGFQMLPKRWVVERTFAWVGRNRRLSKNYEALTSVREAFAMVHLMLARLTESMTSKTCSEYFSLRAAR